jgi:hypothetical protein
MKRLPMSFADRPRWDESILKGMGMELETLPFKDPMLPPDVDSLSDKGFIIRARKRM